MWLSWESATKLAEEKLAVYNKQSTQNYACPRCGAALSVTEYRTGQCHSCGAVVDPEIYRLDQAQ